MPVFGPTTTMLTAAELRHDADGTVWVQVVAHAELTAKTPYKVSENEFGNVSLALTSVGAYTYIGCPRETIASGAVGWIQIRGYMTSMVVSSLSMAVGEAIGLDSSGAVEDRAADFTGKAGEFAVATEATSTANTVNVILHGDVIKDSERFTSDTIASNGIMRRYDMTLTPTSGQSYGQYYLMTTTGIGTGGARSIVGQVTNTAVQTATGGWQLLTGICGICQNTGTWTNTTLFAMAGTFQQAGGGTITAVSHMACVWLDWSNASAVSAGETEMLYITNNAVSGAEDMAQVFYIHASLYSAYKLWYKFSACELGDGFIDYQNVKTTHGGEFRNLKVDISGTTYFFIVSSVPT